MPSACSLLAWILTTPSDISWLTAWGGQGLTPGAKDCSRIEQAIKQPEKPKPAIDVEIVSQPGLARKVVVVATSCSEIAGLIPPTASNVADPAGTVQLLIQLAGQTSFPGFTLLSLRPPFGTCYFAPNICSSLLWALGFIPGLPEIGKSEHDGCPPFIGLRRGTYLARSLERDWPPHHGSDGQMFGSSSLGMPNGFTVAASTFV